MSWRCFLTDQVIGSDYDATNEQQCARDSIVTPKDRVVDDRLIDEIANLHEARDSGHHSENRHCESC